LTIKLNSPFNCQLTLVELCTTRSWYLSGQCVALSSQEFPFIDSIVGLSCRFLLVEWIDWWIIAKCTACSISAIFRTTLYNK